MYIEYITIIAVLLLSYLGHNMTVVYAAGIVLLLKVLGLTTALNALGTQGISNTSTGASSSSRLPSWCPSPMAPSPSTP